jgi:hypothetical protein
LCPCRSFEEQLDAAEIACAAALDRPEMRAVSERCGRLIDAEQELSRLTPEGNSTWITRTVDLTGVDGISFSRWLLLRVALEKIPRVRVWPVFASVKRLWAEEILYYANPVGYLSVFCPRGARFLEMARIVTLRRYPAGQFHWEVTAFPRSWLLQTPPSRWPGLLAALWDLGGFRPMVETHINARRKNRLILTEPEAVRSYYRLARSIELQPEIRGLIVCSWLYCQTTAEVSPHLAWLREFLLTRGAFAAEVGPAPEDSGFLIGSELRRKLYYEGRYKPQHTYMLWARKDILDWARSANLEGSDPLV